MHQLILLSSHVTDAGSERVLVWAIPNVGMSFSSQMALKEY
jgi:hypothetical protein